VKFKLDTQHTFTTTQETLMKEGHFTAQKAKEIINMLQKDTEQDPYTSLITILATSKFITDKTTAAQTTHQFLSQLANSIATDKAQELHSQKTQIENLTNTLPNPHISSWKNVLSRNTPENTVPSWKNLVLDTMKSADLKNIEANDRWFFESSETPEKLF
jgi:hypothetical protein